MNWSNVSFINIKDENYYKINLVIGSNDNIQVTTIGMKSDTFKARDNSGKYIVGNLNYD